MTAGTFIFFSLICSHCLEKCLWYTVSTWNTFLLGLLNSGATEKITGYMVLLCRRLSITMVVPFPNVLMWAVCNFLLYYLYPKWKWKSKSVSHSVTSNSYNSMDCSPPASSVRGILQARILELVAIPFFKGSSWLRNWTQVSCIASRLFTDWAMREVHIFNIFIYK